MEENKEKTVKLESENRKLSYEELNDMAMQLSQQNQQLYAQLQRVNMNNMFRRLDYLFEVVKNGAMFSPEFLDNCIQEIEETMTITEEEQVNTETKEN